MVDNKKGRGKRIPRCWKDGEEAIGISLMNNDVKHGILNTWETCKQIGESRSKTINTSKQMTGNSLFLSIHLNTSQSPLWSRAQVFSAPKTTERTLVYRNLLALKIYVSISQSLVHGYQSKLLQLHTCFLPKILRGKKICLDSSLSASLLSSLGIQGRPFKSFSDPRHNTIWEKLTPLNDTTVTFVTCLNNS